jgi:zinc transport system substrate-binding protein
MRLLAAATLALSLSTACAFAAPNVVTTIKPVHSLVSAVMKGVGEPAILVDGAASPHGYALKPSQAAALQDADVIFWIGPELETFLEKPIETIAGKAAAVALIDVDGVKTLAPREGGAFEAHDHDGHSHGHDHAHGHDHGDEVDGHVWLDPENAKAFVAAIAAALEKADPANAAAYGANASAETARLDALIAATQEKLKPVAGKGFIVFHDAYHYYEARFGVEAAGSITVNPEVAPGAERIAELQAKLKELGAACIFAEPQFEPKLAATVIEGTNARSGTLDPLGASLENGPDLYHQLIDGLTASLTGCLADAS